mgnify:FL=1|jgi:hypothetical protein
MINGQGVFQYNFDKSYYDNFITAKRNSLLAAGSTYSYMDGDWSDYSINKDVDGIITDGGVKIDDYVQRYINDDTPKCVDDKILEALGKAIKDASLENIVNVHLDVIKRFFPPGASELADNIYKPLSKVSFRIK